MEKHCTNKLTLIIKINICILFCVFSHILFAQSKHEDTIYILFDKTKDIHNKNAIFRTFQICIDNKFVNFGYGTATKVEKIKELKYPITSRNKLATIIANDSFEKKPKFYIIEKVGDEYLIRSADYRFRLEEHDESFWNK